MKKKLSVTVVSVLLLVVFTLPRPVLNANAGLFQSPPPTGPTNDSFADAIAVEGLPFSHSMDTSTATVQKKEPVPSCAQGSSWGRSVWYAYTPTQSGSVAVRTETSFSPGFAAYTGKSLNSLAEVGSACWGERLTFRAEAGTTYYFQVGDMYGYGGWLNFYLEGAPPNDDFAGAISFSTLPYSHSMDTSAASLQSGEPTPSCAQGYPWGKSVWYAYTPDQSGSVTARTEAGFSTGLAAYTGLSLGELTQIDSRCWGERLTFHAEAGMTYYFQVGAMYNDGGWLAFYLEGAPPNDDFATADLFSELPYSHSMDTSAASLQSGEPTPTCAQYYSWGKSVWYAYTPDQSGSVTARTEAGFSTAVAAYTGTSLGDLIQMDSRCWGDWLTFRVEAGTTYYFQVGGMWGEGGPLTFYLDVPPPPEVGFGFSPGDPSVFDILWFWDWSWDPAGVGIASQAWDFGDGATGEGCCPTHLYAADGDYMVSLTVTTWDGRSASTSQVIAVRTHDVAITKFAVPGAASAGQTRSIVVGLNSKRYPERVEVQLYKSVPGGYEWVGSLTQSVPVRPASRTTDFHFSYTFTADDANVGKVTFKAVAYLQDARDARPADNEAISSPTKVTR
ncbi:MAG TPA: PKD domain-containing protein [Anaerolineae bacterium]|nr:PKD domain-containing protein [Anaerolineae bacterium]